MLVNAGDDVRLRGTTLAAVPSLAGEVVVDDLVPFSDSTSPPAATGMVQTRVVRAAGGILDFYLRVTELDSHEPLWQAALAWEGTADPVDVDFRVDGLGDVGPERVRRIDSTGSGSRRVTMLVFDFPSPAKVGPTRFFFVRTDARQFHRGAGLTLVGPGEDLADFSDPTGGLGWAWSDSAVTAIVPSY